MINKTELTLQLEESQKLLEAVWRTNMPKFERDSLHDMSKVILDMIEVRSKVAKFGDDFLMADASNAFIDSMDIILLGKINELSSYIFVLTLKYGVADGKSE